jgi:hypothetical protein
MRDYPEKTVKADLAKNRILYYHVSVTYYTGEESNFPSNITVTFGHLRRKADGKYEPISKTILAHALARPPKQASVPNINTMGRDTLMRELKIPESVALKIMKERKENGFFTSPSNFLARMNLLYQNIKSPNPAHQINFESSEYWRGIKELLEKNRITIS